MIRNMHYMQGWQGLKYDMKAYGEGEMVVCITHAGSNIDTERVNSVSLIPFSGNEAWVDVTMIKLEEESL